VICRAGFVMLKTAVTDCAGVLESVTRNSTTADPGIRPAGWPDPPCR
jgi:hypothetical protein